MKSNQIQMDKKSIVIGALGSALLFVTLGANTQNTVQSTVPPSHVWELHNNEYRLWALNKETGEVRVFGETSAGFGKYQICTESVNKGR